MHASFPHQARESHLKLVLLAEILVECTLRVAALPAAYGTLLSRPQIPGLAAHTD